MDPGIIGSIIGAGSSLLGSIFGQPEVESAGDVFRSAFNAKMKMGEKYGISKLVMAGANAGASPWESTGSTLGQAIGSMGQDIGRAVAAGQSAPQRVATRLALEGQGLDNELKRAQIRSMNSRTIRESGPPHPMIPIPRPKPGVGVGPRALPNHRNEPPSRTTGYRLFNHDFVPNPYMSDSATFTNLGGEPMEYVIAPIWAGTEAGYQGAQGVLQLQDWARRTLGQDSVYELLWRAAGGRPGTPIYSPYTKWGGGEGW